MEASTGRDYTQLKNLLIAAGRSTKVDLDAELLIAEVSAGYTWMLAPDWSLSGLAGVTKVIDSTVGVKTGLPNFEASAVGGAALRQSESDIEAIIDEYGISPVIGAMLAYHF